MHAKRGPRNVDRYCKIDIAVSSSKKKRKKRMKNEKIVIFFHIMVICKLCSQLHHDEGGLLFEHVLVRVRILHEAVGAVVRRRS